MWVGLEYTTIPESGIYNVKVGRPSTGGDLSDNS